MSRPTLEELREKVALLKELEELREVLDAAEDIAFDMREISDGEEYEQWAERQEVIAKGLHLLGPAP